MPRRARWGRAEGAGSSAWQARSACHRRPEVQVRSLVVSFFGFGGLARILFAQQAVEGVQPVGPEALVEVQPLMGTGKRPGIEAANMGAAAHLAADQPGMLQRLDVF